MSAITLLVIYSFAIFAASLFGGWLPSFIRLTHTRTQLMMSFVAGLMLGVGCYHLIPHAVATMGGSDSIDRVVWWMVIGLFSMFVLLRAFHFHQHDHIEVDHDHHESLDDTGNTPKLSPSCDHKHGVSQADEHNNSHPLSWAGIALGLSLHTLIDGIALGAAIQADSIHQPAMGLFSIGVFAAIVLHKPLDALSITTLMVATGWSSRARLWVNIGFALMCPIGALLFFWGVDSFSGDRNIFIGSALAFSAGVFLCISLSDLLPEVQFHSHDRGALTLALMLGVALAYGIGFYEPEHGHSPSLPGVERPLDHADH